MFWFLWNADVQMGGRRGGGGGRCNFFAPSFKSSLRLAEHCGPIALPEGMQIPGKAKERLFWLHILAFPELVQAEGHLAIC